MKEPEFFGLSEVLRLHRQQLELYGGSDGVRDQGALESALQAPQWAFHYGSEDLFELAAVYLFHLVKNHPFVDGNKRIGTVCALAFLDRHDLCVGCQLLLPTGDNYNYRFSARQCSILWFTNCL